jgi:hypothetical protein
MNVKEEDFIYAIAALEHCNNVVHAFRLADTVFNVNEERQGWPDIQCVPRRCFGCTKKKLQAQATW